MAKNGLLINYDYCTGCHSCEVACQQEHDFPPGKFGITLSTFELETENPERLMIFHVPFITHYCDLCVAREAQGLKPACVKHCQSQCMEFGDIIELAVKMNEKNRMVLYAP